MSVSFCVAMGPKCLMCILDMLSGPVDGLCLILRMTCVV